VVSIIQSLFIRAKATLSLIDTGGGYHLGTSEYSRPALHPSLLSAPLSHICLTRSQQQQNINIYSSYPNCQHHVVRYFDEDQRKCDYARSILRKTRRGLDWFRPSRRVIAICPVSLYYAMEKLVALYELRAATYIVKRIALKTWQVSDSVIISTSAYPIGTLSTVTSSFVGHRSYWAPGPGNICGIVTSP
jgi:hypothetical protein